MKYFFYVTLLFLYSCTGEDNSKVLDSNWSLKEFSNNTEDGDIVMKMGYGMVSKIISKQLSEEKELSHCVIVYKKNGEEYLLHSISGDLGPEDGVQKISFKEFYKDLKPNSLFVLRHKSDEIKRSEISQEALKINNMNIPFDLGFDKNNNEKMYCSEFVEVTLNNVFSNHFFKTKRINGTDIYTFNSLMGHKDFEIVNKN